MKITILSSKNYDDKSKNYGDCFIIDNGNEVAVFDCGHIEHAKRVIDYIDERGIEKVTVVLSHNDDDHFDGIPYLIEQGRVSKVITILLLTYVDKLLDIIHDGRRKRRAIKEQITTTYNNIAQLGNKGLLDNIYIGKKVIDGVFIEGPTEEYFLDAFAKALNRMEGDTIDRETIVNATSVQISVKIGNQKLLLSGDSSFAAIEDKIESYKYIQLPHHGKLVQAEKIFEVKGNDNGVVYIVSDNTGASNGGSDKLPKGYNIKNTKNGDIELPRDLNIYRVGSYLWSEK